MLKDKSPMSRFEECGKATSLYDLLALIIGGKDSLTKANGVIRECVAPYGAAAPALSAADWRDFVSAGLTKTAAIKIAAAIELGLRLAHAHDKRILENFSDPENVAAFFMIEITKSIAKVAKLIDCEVLDHVIIGDGFYSSLHAKGII